MPLPQDPADGMDELARLVATIQHLTFVSQMTSYTNSLANAITPFSTNAHATNAHALTHAVFRCEIDCVKNPNSCINAALYEAQTDSLVSGGYLAAGYNGIHIGLSLILRIWNC